MHYTNRKFWLYYDQRPKDIQQIADSCYELLKTNPNHPSLHFKKVNKYWSLTSPRLKRTGILVT